MAELRRISHKNSKKEIDFTKPEKDNNGLKQSDETVYDNPGFQGDTQNGQVLPVTNPNGPSGEPSYVDEDDDNAFSRAVGKVQKEVYTFVKENARVLRTIVYIVLLMAYFAYFSYAMYYRFGDEGSWRLMLITVLASLGLLGHFAIKHFLHRRHADSFNFKPYRVAIDKFITKIRLAIVLPVLLMILLVVFIIVDVAIDRPRNLVSLGGMAFFVCVLFIFSHNPSKVQWRAVFWGMALQLIFALLIMRTYWGRDAFEWLGDRVSEFLAYTDAGSIFVFGDLYINHFFAFKVLPVVVFFSTFVSILYYLGVMQVVIKWLGRFLSFCMGTSATESVNAAANIFIGQTEAPLMIRPFLSDMTKSEIHAVMTGGFATIAGGVMAAYIVYGVPANHLLSASVMSAPAALAVSKMFYPETEKTRHKAKDVYNIAKGTERNLIEAASNGASMSISLVANIAVNLIAFVALLDFVNATLVWLGDRVGYDGLKFQLICSYVFWPLAFLMGADQKDCRVIAQLVGTKTFLNEFVAYVDLSTYINNRKTFQEYLSNATNGNWSSDAGTWWYVGDDIHLNATNTVLKGGLISARSVVIATYALCGFSNLSSMGVQLGALGAMAPHRKSDMSKIVFRAMVAGNIACFVTACIAGLFYQDD
ncbi:hypothetical protein BsWGS_00132 [Bradybaena similaris]